MAISRVAAGSSRSALKLDIGTADASSRKGLRLAEYPSASMIAQYTVSSGSPLRSSIAKPLLFAWNL